MSPRSTFFLQDLHRTANFPFLDSHLFATEKFIHTLLSEDEAMGARISVIIMGRLRPGYGIHSNFLQVTAPQPFGLGMGVKDGEVIMRIQYGFNIIFRGV